MVLETSVSFIHLMQMIAREYFIGIPVLKLGSCSIPVRLDVSWMWLLLRDSCECIPVLNYTLVSHCDS
jgi:hypothetical protein